MRKVILILALLSLGVGKAQVVGGYLPLNSTKSATMGGLKVAGNETVTGTFSVGSTATVTGGLRVTGASTIGTGQNNYFGAIISSLLESTSNGYIDNKLRIGGVTTPAANLDVTGTGSVSSSFTVSGRFEKTQGADVASATGSIALGSDGNVFEITGTNAITLIESTGWKNGAEITLLFTSTASLTDGTANSGTLIGFELAGNANFTGSSDDSITLTLCEIGGTVRWIEKCRSVN